MKRGSSNQGFNLIELMTVVSMIGVLSAISAPSMMGWMARQKLNTSREESFWAIQSAKAQAMKERRSWQVSFRNNPVSQRAEFAVHPSNVTDLKAVQRWQPLSGNVRVDEDTTLRCVGKPGASDKFYYVRFGFLGQVEGQLGRVVFATSSGEGKTLPKADNCRDDDVQVKKQRIADKILQGPKRCVVISTLLGALRFGSMEEKGKEGEICS